MPEEELYRCGARATRGEPLAGSVPAGGSDLPFKFESY